MAAKQKVTVSVYPTKPQPSSSQRLAARAALMSTKQAELKQEAAERRAKRASETTDPAKSTPRKATPRRRAR